MSMNLFFSTRKARWIGISLGRVWEGPVLISLVPFFGGVVFPGREGLDAKTATRRMSRRELRTYFVYVKSEANLARSKGELHADARLILAATSCCDMSSNHDCAARNWHPRRQ